MPPEQGFMKFNVDGATRGKLESVEIGGVLRNHRSETSIMFNESGGIKDSNEAESLNIRRALTICKDHGQGKLVIEWDLANAFKWTNKLRRPHGN